jgi:hypothetical protein
MIDHEDKVFTIIATALRAEYGASNIYVAPEYVPKPPKFPAVFIEQMDNAVYERATDNGDIENAATVMYQVDVYSNKNTGKKAQAKAIIASIDRQFAQMRFTRTFLNHVPNMNDATIYRMTARYRRMMTDQDNFEEE